MIRRTLLALSLLLACGGGGGGGGGIGGTLTVRSDLYGEWTMTPDDCFSGERQLFFGADIVGGDDSDLVRIVLDPLEGYALAMNVPGEDVAIVLREDDGCERFDLDLSRGNTRVNNIWEIAGHARVTCRFAELEVSADLSFSGCF